MVFFFYFLCLLFIFFVKYLLRFIFIVVLTFFIVKIRTFKPTRTVSNLKFHFNNRWQSGHWSRLHHGNKYSCTRIEWFQACIEWHEASDQQKSYSTRWFLIGPMVDTWNCVHITCKNVNGSVLKDTHSKILRNYKTKILSQNDKNKEEKNKKKTTNPQFVHNFAFAYKNFKFSK